MPVLTPCLTVAVCTRHCKVQDRGVWQRSTWSATLANRSHLTLVEACCDVCLFVARRSLHALWRARYRGPSSNGAESSAKLSRFVDSSR